jgi:nucleotide-binding universal stress UspA family protein
MFRKILVALDRSSEASAVLNSALSIAQPETTELLLVHFIDWQMQDVSPWIGIGTLYDLDLSGERYNLSHQGLQVEVEIVNHWLKAIAEEAEKLGIKCEYECHVGNCNLGITDLAKNWRANLIVLGRRGHRNISEMFLGSVSNYVIHHAPCSIFVVQGGEDSNTDELGEFSVVSEISG